MIKVTNIRYEPLSGQVVVGGSDNQLSDFDFYSLSSIELFPRPPSDNCSIPDLPQARDGPSLSLLSGGRLVVCGGEDDSWNYLDNHETRNYLDDCISWVAGNTSWTPLYTMRCLPIIMDKPSSSDCCLDLFLILYSANCQTQKIIICHNHHLYQTQSQRGETLSHGLDAAFSSQLHRPAWRL